MIKRKNVCVYLVLQSVSVVRSTRLCLTATKPNLPWQKHRTMARYAPNWSCFAHHSFTMSFKSYVAFPLNTQSFALQRKVNKRFKPVPKSRPPWGLSSTGSTPAALRQASRFKQPENFYMFDVIFYAQEVVKLMLQWMPDKRRPETAWNIYQRTEVTNLFPSKHYSDLNTRKYHFQVVHEKKLHFGRRKERWTERCLCQTRRPGWSCASSTPWSRSTARWAFSKIQNQNI